MKHLFNNLYVSGQLQENDFATLRESGISIIINNRPDNEEPGQLGAARAAEIAQDNDIQYHYLPLANGQPLPPTLVDDFKKIVESSDGKILAHCRTGMRSSLIWALGQIPQGTVNVDQAIEAAQAAGIPLSNARPILESVAP